jgi:hypothetical protein
MIHLNLDSWTEHLFSIVTKQPTNVSRNYQDFINAFLYLPHHASASHCNYQGSWVPQKLLKQCILYQGFQLAE